MPVYVYKCPMCGAQKEDIRCVAQRHDGPRCHMCPAPTHPRGKGAPAMKLIITTAPAGIVKNPAAGEGTS